MKQKYTLKDLYKIYHAYTKDDRPFSSSVFAKRLNTTLKTYYRDDQLPIKKEPVKKHYGLHDAYAFTEKEVSILGLLISSCVARANKSIQHVDNKVINPFRNPPKASDYGLSNFKLHTEYLLNNINGNSDLHIDNSMLADTLSILDFASSLKNSLGALITAIFQNQNFNKHTFNRIIKRIDGFTQEMCLYNGISEKCNQEMITAIIEDYNALPKHYDTIKDKYEIIRKQKNPPFHTVDTLLADSVLCTLTNKSTKKSGAEMNIEYSKKNYISYLFSIVPAMVKDFYNLINTDCFIDVVQERRYSDFYEKYGININPHKESAYNLETLIFEVFVNPQIDQVGSNGLTCEELSDKILEELKKIIEDNQQDVEYLVSKDSLGIQKQLDLLLFKPFTALHKIDIETIKNK